MKDFSKVREFVVRNIEWVAAVGAFVLVGNLLGERSYGGIAAIAAAAAAYWIAKRFEPKP